MKLLVQGARKEEPNLPPCQDDEAEAVTFSLAKCSEEATGAEVLPVRATSTSDLAAGWTMKQVEEWKDCNSWLDLKAGKLGCFVCRKAKMLLISEQGLGLHLTKEWINGDVTSSDTKKLHKKINQYKHRDSQAHQRSVEIL